MADIAVSVLAKLKIKANENNLQFQQMLILFCQEEFLRRISKSRINEAYQKSFVDILRKSIMTAATGKNLVTIDIEPTHPETGYGYIHFGDKLHTIDG